MFVLLLIFVKKSLKTWLWYKALLKHCIDMLRCASANDITLKEKKNIYGLFIKLKLSRVATCLFKGMWQQSFKINNISL